MREYYRKGRAYEKHDREITEPDGRKIVEVHEVRYVTDGPLAGLLTKLGFSQPNSGPPTDDA